LHTALTENRKSGNPVVIGFQGRSQLEVRYGHEAEAMLSQPATKIFLHTSEPRAAKWISDTLGEVEMERMKEVEVVTELLAHLHQEFGKQVGRCSQVPVVINLSLLWRLPAPVIVVVEQFFPSILNSLLRCGCEFDVDHV
jgi:Type IV secretion-system coupling protein DNA-binding domain